MLTTPNTFNPNITPVATIITQTNKNLGALQGQLYRHISKFKTTLIEELEKQTKDIPDILQYRQFRYILSKSAPFTFAKQGHSDNTIHVKQWCTNLDILGKMLEDEFTQTFLSKNNEQLHTLTRLRTNFEILLEVYYAYCIIQDPQQISTTLSDLFKFINVKSTFKYSKDDLSRILDMTSLEAKQFSEATKLFTEASFHLMVHLVLNH